MDVNGKVLVLPDATMFRADQRHGGAFQLINDNEHYLQIQRSIFSSIKHNYSIELWIRPNYYPIIIGDHQDESLSNPIILDIPQAPNSSLRLECDATHLLLNRQKMAEYRGGQWIQLVLVFGQSDVAQSRSSYVYVNSKLVKEGHFLPKLNYNQMGQSTNLIGAETPKQKRSPLITADDTQNLQWAIMRLYRRSLSPLEVRQNYLGHSHRFGLNRENPHIITTEDLIAYFDAGLKLSYKFPSVMINNIAIFPPHLFTHNVKIYQDNYIYNRYHQPAMPTSELSKMVAQILSRQSNYKKDANRTKVHATMTPPMINQPEIKTPLDKQLDLNDPNQRQQILNYLDQNPKQLMRLIHPQSQERLILDWKYIQSTPIVIELLQQFYRNNPDTFTQVMEN
jgi:hypothetical protein